MLLLTYDRVPVYYWESHAMWNHLFHMIVETLACQERQGLRILNPRARLFYQESQCRKQCNIVEQCKN